MNHQPPHLKLRRRHPLDQLHWCPHLAQLLQLHHSLHLGTTLQLIRGWGVRLSRSAGPCSNPGWLYYSKQSKQLNCCFSFTHSLFKHLPMWHNTGTKDKFRLLFQNADDGRIQLLVRDMSVMCGTACFYTTVHCVRKSFRPPLA